MPYPASQIGAGWGAYNALETVGDFSGDGALDVLARDAATGDLWLYRGNGKGGWLRPRPGRHGLEHLQRDRRAGDFNGDQRVDVLARQRLRPGALFLYAGNGTGGWRTRAAWATGWNILSATRRPRRRQR